MKKFKVTIITGKEETIMYEMIVLAEGIRVSRNEMIYEFYNKGDIDPSYRFPVGSTIVEKIDGKEE